MIQYCLITPIRLRSNVPGKPHIRFMLVVSYSIARLANWSQSLSLSFSTWARWKICPFQICQRSHIRFTKRPMDLLVSFFITKANGTWLLVGVSLLSKLSGAWKYLRKSTTWPGYTLDSPIWWRLSIQTTRSLLTTRAKRNWYLLVYIILNLSKKLFGTANMDSKVHGVVSSLPAWNFLYSINTPSKK